MSHKLCGFLFCVLSQEMRHIHFLGSPQWGLNIFLCFFCPLFWGQKGGPKRAIFGHKKQNFSLLFLPALKNMGKAVAVPHPFGLGTVWSSKASTVFQAYMGENARFKNGHARRNARFKNTKRVEMVFGPLLSNGRQRVGAFEKKKKKPHVEKMILNILVGILAPKQNI